jgi:hypothetical protein
MTATLASEAFFNGLDRIPDAQLPAPALACLSTVPSSKTRPTIIVSIGGSAEGFRDTERRHPAGSGPLIPVTPILGITFSVIPLDRVRTQFQITVLFPGYWNQFPRGRGRRRAPGKWLGMKTPL